MSKPSVFKPETLQEVRRDKDKIKALFDCLCKTHESLSSANGRVKIKEEKLILDENITSLSDMVNFQLNI